MKIRLPRKEILEHLPQRWTGTHTQINQDGAGCTDVRNRITPCGNTILATVAKIPFHTIFIFYKFVSATTDAICLARSSGGITLLTILLRDSSCVTLLQNQGKNTSPALLSSFSSMLRNNRVVLQIHIHANVKHIQIWNLQSHHTKLTWALNIQGCTKLVNSSSVDRRQEGSPKVKWQEAKNRHHLEKEQIS